MKTLIILALDLLLVAIVCAFFYCSTITKTLTKELKTMRITEQRESELVKLYDDLKTIYKEREERYLSGELLRDITEKIANPVRVLASYWLCKNSGNLANLVLHNVNVLTSYYLSLDDYLNGRYESRERYLDSIYNAVGVIRYAILSERELANIVKN